MQHENVEIEPWVESSLDRGTTLGEMYSQVQGDNGKSRPSGRSKPKTPSLGSRRCFARFGVRIFFHGYRGHSLFGRGMCMFHGDLILLAQGHAITLRLQAAFARLHLVTVSSAPILDIS